MEDKTSEIDRLELGRKLVRTYWKPIYEGTALLLVSLYSRYTETLAMKIRAYVFDNFITEAEAKFFRDYVKYGIPNPSKQVALKKQLIEKQKKLLV